MTPDDHAVRHLARGLVLALLIAALFVATLFLSLRRQREIVYVDGGEYGYDAIGGDGAACCYDALGRYVGPQGGLYRHPILIAYPRGSVPRGSAYLTRQQITNSSTINNVSVTNVYIREAGQPAASARPAPAAIPGLPTVAAPRATVLPTAAAPAPPPVKPTVLATAAPLVKPAVVPTATPRPPPPAQVAPTAKPQIAPTPRR